MPIILDVSIILVLTASDFLTIVSFLNAVYGCAQLLEFAAFLRLRSQDDGSLPRPCAPDLGHLR